MTDTLDTLLTVGLYKQQPAAVKPTSVGLLKVRPHGRHMQVRRLRILDTQSEKSVNKPEPG